MSFNAWQGERVRLRGVEPDDWKIYMEWDLDSETARLCYFVPFPQSSASAQRLAQETALKRGEGDVYNWMIENSDGVTVGNINTHNIERRHGTFSYGVALRREHWGQGYAGEAIRLVLKHYFNELGYQKCNVDVYSFNIPSIRLHEKLGFVREGQQRRSIFTNGQYYDNIFFGITMEEFRSRWLD